ncbi:MAG: calcium/sodium antiporter [Salibacteraceae bacterium]
MNVALIILGIVILVVGGELLVRGAVNVALRFHISTLVVGMTVVSFGTSAPELLVSLEAMYTGHPGIAIGNVVGSNIANIALVLGLTAIIFPIEVSRNSYRIDWPVLMLSSLLVYSFMWFNVDYEIGKDYLTSLNWVNGIIMVSILVGFSYFLIWKSRKSTKAGHAEMDHVPEIPKTSLIKDVAFIVFGSIGLSAGAHFLVEGTVGLASVLGISDYIISVTIVAFGTSLPELMTSVVAAFKKHADLSVGNLIGSNIFNILGILGITSIFKTIPISEMVLKVDMIWVLGISLLVFPMMVTRKRISKTEGAVLFIAYAVYVYFTVVGN